MLFRILSRAIELQKLQLFLGAVEQFVLDIYLTDAYLHT